MDAFEEAHADCLKTCFDTLVDNLVTAEPDAEAKFKACCEVCRRAKEIAGKREDGKSSNGGKA